MSPIHLTYTPDRADFLAAIRARKAPRWHWWAFLASLFGIGMLVGLLGDLVPAIGAAMAWKAPVGEKTVVTAAVGLWAAIVFGLRFAERWLRATSAASRSGPFALLVDGSGIAITEAGRSEFFPWRDVAATWLRRGRLFIALAGGRLVAVPRRAFTDDQAMAAFATIIEDHVRSDSEREDAIPGATTEVAP